MRAQSPLLDDANHDLENNEWRNVLSGRRLKLCDFTQIIYQIVPYASDVVPINVFSWIVTLKTPCLQLPENVPWNEACEKLLVEA